MKWCGHLTWYLSCDQQYRMIYFGYLILNWIKFLTNIKITIFSLNPSSLSLFWDLLLFFNLRILKTFSPLYYAPNRSCECLESAHACMFGIAQKSFHFNTNIENRYLFLLLKYFSCCLCSLWPHFFFFYYFLLFLYSYFVNLNLYCLLKCWWEFKIKTNIEIYF